MAEILCLSCTHFAPALDPNVAALMIFEGDRYPAEVFPLWTAS